MPEYEVFLDEIIDETITRLAYHATEIQTRIDTFITIQTPNLDPEQIEAIVLGGTRSVLVEIDAAKNLILRQLIDAITEAAQTGLYDHQKSTKPGSDYRWQIESGNPCPDCVNRSAQNPQPLSYWEAVGLPKSGVTVCGSRCKCILVPTS